MTDIVERLRSGRANLNSGRCCGQVDSVGTCVAPACIFGDALREMYDAADEIERLRACVVAARRGGVEAAMAVASQRAASRHDEAAHCVSDRSKKHMQIRADEAGQIVADIRALLKEGEK